MDKNTDAQRVTCPKSHKLKGLDRDLNPDSPTNMPRLFEQKCFPNIFFFNSKNSLKMKMCVEIQYIQQIQIGALRIKMDLLGPELLFWELPLPKPRMALESPSHRPGTLRNIILNPQHTTLSLDSI